MPELLRHDDKVVIVGSGWAGLAAAVTLTRRGIPVHLLESSQQPGGRARTVRSGDLLVDNGQHLMIGAYHSTLRLMTEVGVDPGQVLERMPLTLKLINRRQTSLFLKAPRLPAPWHLLAAILTTRGLSTGEKLKAIRFGRYALAHTLSTDADISVLALLHSQAQSPELIRKLWEPLCIAALNTPMDIASARIFMHVLKSTFAGSRQHSDLLIPRRELSDLLPRPGLAYLDAHGAKIELGQRVTSITVDEGRVTGVYIGDRHIDSSRVILATPPVISSRLLTGQSVLNRLGQQLAELGSEPVATLYLQYPTETKIDIPILGLESSLGHWVFDRGICGQPGLMAVVISARGDHHALTGEELTTRVVNELASCFPDWPAPEYSRLVREKRATFCSRVGVDAVRPDNRTDVQGLWLAGDYTNTGLPATLESAVRSGTACARALLGQPGL